MELDNEGASSLVLALAKNNQPLVPDKQHIL
jgi:hypothetical protein